MNRGLPMLSFAGLMGLAFVAILAVGAAPAEAAGDKTSVVIETVLGNITVELADKDVPKTVANFLSYVDKGFYDGTIFHRVIGPSPDKPDGFMIQGGGFTPDMQQKETDAPIKNESIVFNKTGMRNRRGTIAMARTGDPHSATSQFFINLTDKNSFLDDAAGAGYTAFGTVTEGMDVVDKIAKVETGRKARMDDVPVKPVVIKSIKRKAAK